jgi:hypothetical protein
MSAIVFKHPSTILAKRDILGLAVTKFSRTFSYSTFLLSFSLGCFIFFSHYSVARQDNKQQESNSEQKPEKKPGSSTSRLRSQIDIPEPISMQQQYNNDLQHYLKSSQITPLLAGAQDFMTLIQPSLSSNNKGVAILLPDWQQGAMTPKALNFLRQQLPNQGWTTITIQPFDKPNNYPSFAINAGERQEKNNQIIEQYQEKLSAVIKTVMLKAKNYPGIFIVVVQGNHSAILADLYQQEKNQAPNALILLSGYMLTDEDNKMFATNIAESEVPVLDLFLERDHPLAQSNAKTRKLLAKKELKTYYRQTQFNNFSSGYYPQQALLLEINGWLKSIGW